MGAFSVLYTINIAVSNLSLHLVTVPVSPDDILACNTETHMLMVMLFLRILLYSSIKSFERRHHCSPSSYRSCSSVASLV